MWRKGEAKYDDLEKRLAETPDITVPTIAIEGDANGALTRTRVPMPSSLGQI